MMNEFIKNPSIVHPALACTLLDLILSHSIKHTLALFGLPYLTSIALTYRYRPKKIVLTARMSEQYRPGAWTGFKNMRKTDE